MINVNKSMKAVLFDLDGVICHTDKLHYIAWKRLADEMGIYFDEELNGRFRGVSRMKCLEMLIGKELKLSEAKKIELADRKNRYYQELLVDITEKDLAHEVEETLEELRKRRYLLAIASSSRNAGIILKNLGLENFFDQVVDGNEITRTKPDPEVFLLAARRLKVAPEKCLVVEDSKAGIDGAVSCGMQTAGIGLAAEYVKTSYKIKNIRELLHIL